MCTIIFLAYKLWNNLITLVCKQGEPIFEILTSLTNFCLSFFKIFLSLSAYSLAILIVGKRYITPTPHCYTYPFVPTPSLFKKVTYPPPHLYPHPHTLYIYHLIHILQLDPWPPLSIHIPHPIYTIQHLFILSIPYCTTSISISWWIERFQPCL